MRLKIEDRPLRFHDLVRGDVEFAAETVSDPILVRSATGERGGESAGIPVYNYVVTVDDALMEITHVIRGDDHISNTPKQVAIYQAFGWPVPEFAHLSTILGADRERLSKRHGATSISTFREMGYLPEALVNYLALLGWGAEDGKTETFTLEELTQAFSLERVTPSPAIFDFDKLNWLNRHYLKLAAPARLARWRGRTLPIACLPTKRRPEPVNEWFERLLALFVPAVDHLDQLPAKAAPCSSSTAMRRAPTRRMPPILAADSARTVLGELASRVRDLFAATSRPTLFKAWMNEIKTATGVKGEELFHPVRIALTGAHSGPEFDKLLPLIEEGATLGLGIPERPRAGRVFRGGLNAVTDIFWIDGDPAAGAGDRAAPARRQTGSKTRCCALEARRHRHAGFAARTARSRVAGPGGRTGRGEEVGMEFLSYPIPDTHVPPSPTELPRLCRGACRRLRAGERIGVHCRGSIGRATVTAACTLIHLGWKPARRA